jgi:phosphohistidine phosphatase
MDLYILRHGDAAPNRATHADDNARELTERGVSEIETVISQAMRTGMAPPTAIITSPLPRAKKTAEIAMREWQAAASIEVTSTLVKNDVLPLMQEISDLYPTHHTVLIAGHEPLLSLFASALLSGSERSFIELEKGGLIHLSVYQMDPVRMRAFLRLYLTPASLGAGK